MAKVQFHYKHIAITFLLLICFTALTITIWYDITKKDVKSNIQTPIHSEEKAVVYDLPSNLEPIRTSSQRNYIPKADPIPRRVTPPPQKIPNPIPKVKDPIQRFADPIQTVTDPLPRNINPAPRKESHSLPITADDTLDSLTRFVEVKLHGNVPKIPHDNFYVAAVIDFQPLILGDVQTKARYNVDQYVEIIKECEKYTVDIVVFPEYGIFQGYDDKDLTFRVAPEIPAAKDGVIPCDQRIYDEILTKLSCAAKNNKMYVSATMLEKYCIENTACSRGDLFLFLTTVVFDRNGTIVARYRKYNLHTERWIPGVDQVTDPELVTFTTDFNVTFGIVNSHDLYFKYPSVALLQRYNVTDIIYPSSVATRLPFLAASSLVAGWSYAMNVNVLASRTSDLFGVAGNNVFFGQRESTETYMTDLGFSNIVIAAVPKPNASFTYNFGAPFLTLLKYDNRKRHINYLIEHSLNLIKMEPLFNEKYESVRTFNFMTDNFFCNISIVWKPSLTTFGLPGYRMAGYSGFTNYSLSSVNNYVQMCGLMLCGSLTSLFCILPPTFEDTSKVTINSMKVIAASRVASGDVRIPITLRSDMTALDPEYYEYSNYIKNITGQRFNFAEIILRKPVSNLMAFGIYKLPDKSNPLLAHNVIDVALNADTVLG